MENWGSYSNNILYNPEACGVEIVAQLDADLSWEFDIVLLLKYDGKYWLASDSGCSCPTPFENVRSTADLTPLRSEQDALDIIRGDYREFRTADVLDFMRKVREVL